jgi:hypothetical protein
MFMNPRNMMLPIAFALLTFPAMADDGKVTAKPAETAHREAAVLWRDPVDIGSRNLFFGSGGEKDQPHGPFTFVEEDLHGTNPKYVVRDRDNVKWTVKLGLEARPETVATRLVWAAGYFTNEDYFLEDIQVDHMPAHLKRGGNLVAKDGSMHAARLKRHIEDQKKLENWSWRHDPLVGTRGMNGLKVMMALINNWDMKDDNNEVYGGKKASEEIYVVSDLGASFGSTGRTLPLSHGKGYLPAYKHSRFITKADPEFVNFSVPSAPEILYVFNIFKLPEYVWRIRMDSLGKHIPRADAQWVGHVLSGLSGAQIRDAFRAGGYTPELVEGFSKVVENRISQLNRL